MITLWSLPDVLWERVEWLLEQHDPQMATRPHARPGAAFHGQINLQLPQRRG
jgi:hypothetical protein